MESEKVKEIKELLKCMNGEKACTNCYINEIAEEQETYCINVVADMTLDLINELESENERLQRDYVVNAYDKLRAENKKLKDRIAELEKENAKYKQKLTTNQWVQEIRKEALKEFAERLKEKLFDLGNIVNENDIDETLKEFEK